MRFYSNDGYEVVPENVYCHHIPLIFRDRDKYWCRDYGAAPLHRITGPAMFDGPLRLWFCKNQEFTDEVYVWCRKHEMDMDDLTEQEALMMWMEIT